MEGYGREASERLCYFGVEFLRVGQAAEVAGIRLLPLDDPEIPDTNPQLACRREARFAIETAAMRGVQHV